MFGIHALSRLIFLMTGWCRQCRNSGRIARSGFWGRREKPCPTCTPPGEGKRVLAA